MDDDRMKVMDASSPRLDRFEREWLAAALRQFQDSDWEHRERKARLAPADQHRDEILERTKAEQEAAIDRLGDLIAMAAVRLAGAVVQGALRVQAARAGQPGAAVPATAEPPAPATPPAAAAEAPPAEPARNKGRSSRGRPPGW